jgi:chromosome segregation ATPase
MTQLQKALLVMLVAVVGIWGCAQGPGGSASAEKIKALEGKVNRLDEDFRAAAAARDQYRKKLTDAEQATAQLKNEIEALQLVVKDRDDLRGLLKAKATELTAVNGQFESFRKSLKDLIGQTEAAMTAPPAGTPGTTVSLPKADK